MKNHIPILALLLIPAIFFISKIFNSATLNAQPSDTSTSLQKPFIDNESTELAWYTKLNNDYQLKDENHKTYLYVNVQTFQPDVEIKRSPLNLSVVIDRSGSMSGEKLDFAKEAVLKLIDQLSSNDYLSIVTYDDEVEVLSSSQKVMDKAKLRNIVRNINLGGSTNLTGGANEGYRQINSTKKPEFINRVLLMTDGLANVGIVEPSKIKNIVRTKFIENGIALSTFGIGADYNENLLTMMAEAGGGNYYYIDEPNKLTSIFNKEMNGLVNIVAKKVNLEVKVPKGYICTKVYGYKAEIGTDVVKIPLSDMYGDDKRIIVLELEGGGTSSVPIDSKLSYESVAKEKTIMDSKRVVQTLTTDKSLYLKSEDLDIMNEIASFQASEELENIMSYADNGNYEKAKTDAKISLSKIRGIQAKNPSAILKKQEEQLNKYVEQLDVAPSMNETEVKKMQKSTKETNYNFTKRK